MLQDTINALIMLQLNAIKTNVRIFEQNAQQIENKSLS